MGFKLPPQHRADARGLFVAATDPAWDFDRCAREREEMAERGEDPDQHIVSRYVRGETRYDLAAEGGKVYEYFDETKAWIFELKRIPVATRKALEDILIRAGGSQWLYGCCKHGLKKGKVTNAGDFEIQYSGEAVSDATIDRLGSVGEGTGVDGKAKPHLDDQIGVAAWEFSKPLSEAEKKH